MERYAGRPFLRLLECYVLDAIGQLDAGQHDALRRMEPKLGGLYGAPGPWQAIVATQMDFPTSLPQQIRDLWAHNREQAQRRGEVASPEAFATAFVDQNFPDVVR